MSEAATFTVLMGVRNGGHQLKGAVESILGQTFTDFEFLVIDDGSTDGTARYLEECAARDHRIRVLKNDQPLGLASCLRRGTEEARGLWIARMDSDDVAKPERLAKQWERLAAGDIDVLGTWATLVDREGKAHGIRKAPITHEQILARLWANPFIHPTVCIRREALLRCGNYSAIRRSEDYELWFRCAQSGLRFGNLPEPLLLYRYDDSSVNKYSVRQYCQSTVIGWKGLRRIKAPSWQYAAVCYPLVRRMLPSPLAVGIHRAMQSIDPRQRWN